MQIEFLLKLAGNGNKLPSKDGNCLQASDWIARALYCFTPTCIVQFQSRLVIAKSLWQEI